MLQNYHTKPHCVPYLFRCSSLFFICLKDLPQMSQVCCGWSWTRTCFVMSDLSQPLQSSRSQTQWKIQVLMAHQHVIGTHTHTQLFNGLLSGTTRVGRYQKKHSPTASSLFSLRAWQSSRTTSLQVLFGLPLGLGPSTSYSMHFFTQSSSTFCSTCPYQRSLFCCNTNACHRKFNAIKSEVL